MNRDEQAAFDDAIEAGRRAHLLTIGSEPRLALRVATGRLDRRGRWHRWQPDVFVIWRDSRRSVRELAERAREGFWQGLANRLPRPLAYWATIRVGAHATTGRYSNTVVPEMPFMDALARWPTDG